jgi:hypothetical protein
MQPDEQSMYVTQIKPRDTAGVRLDLKEIVDALWPAISTLEFSITDLDAQGDDDIQRVCDLVDEKQPSGHWVTAEGLREIVSKISQTMDAEILAYEPGTSPGTLEADDSNLAAIPSNKIVLAITAVDSSFFEVYARSKAIDDRLKERFADARSMNPQDYF